jgi:hypothetical protein
LTVELLPLAPELLPLPPPPPQAYRKQTTARIANKMLLFFMENLLAKLRVATNGGLP